jgi:Leucine-rich repeat (LRR) protein/subtilisin-like proprotein convertase family protein
MASIDLGLLTSSIQHNDQVSALELNDVFRFSLATSQDVVFSLGAELSWTVRDQSGAIVAEPDADYRGGEVALTNLDDGILYSLEVRRTDQDRDYTLTIAPSDRPAIDPLTGENAAASAEGVFIVGDDGQLEFDYALDGGRYQGEAGIVSLRNLDDVAWGSVDWTREIIDRVLSNSSLGYRLVNDRVDNPWIDLFHAEAGEYRGSQILAMTPGDTVAIVLIPNGTFTEVLANPEIGGNKRPLFSIATANPDDQFYFGQIAVADRDVYVMEDKRIDLGSDRDYNDFGFRLTGVTPRGIGTIDDLIEIAPGDDDWRTLVPRWDNVAPIVEFDVTGLDRREFPLSGTVSDGNGAWDIDGLTAEVIDGSGAVVRTIAINLTPSGQGQTFVIDRDVVTDGLGAGDYQLMLTPRDRRDAGEAIVAIDLVIPRSNSTTDPGGNSDPDPNPDFDPTNAAPTAPILDAFTNAYDRGTTLTLSGQVTDADGWADIDRIVIDLLDPAGESVQITTINSLTTSDDDTARFAVEIALAATFAAGSYGLRVMAIDAAGATSAIASQSLTVTIPTSKVDPVNDPDPSDPDPIQRPNLLKFGALPLYTTSETLRFRNARTADPDGWDNIARVDFAWVAPDGTVIDIAEDVTEFRNGGDGTARFDFEVELAGLTPGEYQLRGRAIDYDADGSVSGAYAQWSQSVWVVSGDDSESGGGTLANQVRFGVADRLKQLNDPERMAEPATSWVLWLTPETEIAAVQAAIGATAFSPTAIDNTWSFELDGSQTNAVIRDQLAAIDGVELFYPDAKQSLVYHAPPGKETDILFEDQWPLHTGGTAGDQTIEQIWREFGLGNGEQITFIDGGFDLSDREFTGRIAGQYDFTDDPTGMVGQINHHEGQPSPIDDDSQVMPRPLQAFPDDKRLSYEIFVPVSGLLTDLSVGLTLAAGLTDAEREELESLTVKIHVPSANAQLLDLKDAARNGFWSWRPGWENGDEEAPPNVFVKLGELDPQNLTHTVFERPSFDWGQTFENYREWMEAKQKYDLAFEDYLNRLSEVKHQFAGGRWTVSFASEEQDLSAELEALIERAIESVQISLDYADTHGTSVMSIAASGVNPTGRKKSMIGVAPEADIIALQLIGELDPLTQSYSQGGVKIGKALGGITREDRRIPLSIVNNSWGTEPFAMFPEAITALQDEFSAGDNGRGTVYVWSAGNDRSFWPGVGQLGQYELNSSRFGISVGAAAFDGAGWFATDYSNGGAFVVAPSSAHIGMPKEGEFDSRFPVLSGKANAEDYAYTFSGTSAAAPFVSGVVALLRERNPNLTARDIQYILAETAQPIDLGYDANSVVTRSLPYLDDNGDQQTTQVPENWFDINHDAAALGIASGWSQNGAEKWFSYRHGFGLVDAYAAIELANPATYELLPELVSYGDTEIPAFQYVSEAIPEGGTSIDSSQWIDEDIQLEWAEVAITTDHENWSELTFVLESPLGTSVVLKRAMADAIPVKGERLPVGSPVLNPGEGWVTDPSDVSSELRSWTFSTPFFRGESALGDWTLRVYDEHDNDVSGELMGWTLDVFGTQDRIAPSIVVEPIQEWARQAGSAGYEVGESVAVDNAGNAFLAGWITGNIDGHTYQGRDTTVGTGGDTYLARYDQEGTQLWQRSIGTDGYDAFYGVTTDVDGNAYAVGATNRAIGGATNFGLGDGIIVKYDTSGNIAWTKQIGTSEFDRFWDVQTDGAGNFYAVGSTGGLLNGSRSHAGYDALVVKFDADGNIDWTRQLTSTANSNTEGLHAAIDPTTNDILITGQVGGTLNGETSAGKRDIFVARYSPAGDLLWNTQFGSSEDDATQAIDIANDGMIYIAGTTYGVLPGETAGENRDVVVAKLGKDGSLIWTDQFSVEGVGGERDSDDYAYGLVVDGNQILVSGHVGGSLDGNPAAGQIDAFLATYDTQGRRGESLQFGFPSWDSLKELVTDGAGTTYGVGSISGALPGETQAGSLDLMLAKFSRSQEYVPGEPLALTDIGVNDDGELVTATLTLSDAAAGTLATTVANEASVEFSGGRLTVKGSPDEVNAVLAGVEFTAALGYDGDVTIATGVSDGFNAAIGETISLSMDNDGLRLDPVDYAALRALYESTDGENWTNNTGWSDWDFSREVPPLVSIVEDWHGIDTSDNNVSSIFISSNNLTGEIPAELGNLSNLLELWLNNNDLSGEIPVELGNLSNLKYFELSDNTLSGEIPVELENLSSLEYLEIANNTLSGEIPIELGNLSNLVRLSLEKNTLSGEIPAELGNLPNLSYLSLDNNTLSGEIPIELGNLPNLSYLSLDNNTLSGEIPIELGNLPNLSYLSLANNILSGEIPTELGNLPSLWYLSLHSNTLSGEIPVELGNLSKLWHLYLSGNTLSGEIPAELGNLSDLLDLQLHNNALSGEIPTELLNLDNLTTLYLQNNNLTGMIPAGLINPPTIEMPSLVNIDLSGNNFWNPSLTVTNTNDTGIGSLRAAIALANITPGTDPIVFNIPTSDPGYNATTGAFTIRPLSALHVITDSIVIDGTSQTGYSDRPLIELDGSNAGASVDGLGLSATDSIIRGLAINRFSSDGIQAAGARNTFSNNFLGTDVTGTVDLGNGVSGLFIGIGDSDIVENNLISGNATGFETRGNNAIVRRNLIGTDITGTRDLGNDANGISLYNGASNNQVGSTSEADRNIIAGNNNHGILIDGSNNRIQGNYIGIDITGNNALANDRQGIRLSATSGSSGNLIGGTEAGAGNVIANGDRGIVVYADNTTIQGNLIGTDATGTRNFGSNSQAIRIETGADGTMIGGASANARNIISGSKTTQGISISGNNTTIQGNYIGTDITGTQAIPNAQSGIYLFEPSSNNLIGGTGIGEGNMIANNNNYGIGVQGIASINNTIAGNSLFSNNGVGISILEGANAGRLAPTLTTAIRSDNQTRIAGNLTAPANTTVRVEFFSDATTEGRQYLGASNVTTDGAGNATFDVILDQKATGQNITATVTDATGNTSKLSSPRPLT